MQALLPYRQYQLSRDVQNPSRDRRSRYSIRTAAWLAGDRFTSFVNHRTGEVQPGLLVVSAQDVKGRQLFEVLDSTVPGYEQLMDALELLPETLGDVLRLGCGRSGANVEREAAEVLEMLFKQGVVTREQVLDACRANNAEEA